MTRLSEFEGIRFANFSLAMEYKEGESRGRTDLPKVYGIFPLREYRGMINEGSGKRNFPDIIVMAVPNGFDADLAAARIRYPKAETELQPKVSFIDGAIELVPTIGVPELRPPVLKRQDQKREQALNGSH